MKNENVFMKQKRYDSGPILTERKGHDFIKAISEAGAAGKIGDDFKNSLGDLDSFQEMK